MSGMHGWSSGVVEKCAGLVLIYTVWVCLLRTRFQFVMTTILTSIQRAVLCTSS
jgi:hypothetical protein